MMKEYLDQKYWGALKKQTSKAGITLDPDVSSSDFEIYGDRLAARQLQMFQNAGQFPIPESTVLDVGCGIGRIVKPFAKKFKKVIGIDINENILKEAKLYLQNQENIELIENDGKSIPFDNNYFEYVYCGGVLQHIPDIDVITNYFEEGLRVLKVNGILNYSIQVWMIYRNGGVSGDRVGAQVRAKDIEQILNKTGHELEKIYYDENDPVPHFNIIIRKLDDITANKNIQIRKRKPYRIKESLIEKMDIRTGIFEDLESYSNLKKAWENKDKLRMITFFKQPFCLRNNKYFRLFYMKKD